MSCGNVACTSINSNYVIAYVRDSTHLRVKLTHWCGMTHLCVDNLTIIGSDNGLSPGRRQAIIWTNVGILLIGPLGTNFGEILFEIHTFEFKKMQFKTSFVKWRPFCFGLNMLKCIREVFDISLNWCVMFCSFDQLPTLTFVITFQTSLWL